MYLEIDHEEFQPRPHEEEKREEPIDSESLPRPFMQNPFESSRVEFGFGHCPYNPMFTINSSLDKNYHDIPRKEMHD